MTYNEIVAKAPEIGEYINKLKPFKSEYDNPWDAYEKAKFDLAPFIPPGGRWIVCKKIADKLNI